MNSCFYEWFEQSIVDAKYAIEGAKLQKALILWTHLKPQLFYYGENSGSTVELYFEKTSNKAQSWFNGINKMTEMEGFNDVKPIFLLMVNINYRSNDHLCFW